MKRIIKILIILISMCQLSFAGIFGGGGSGIGKLVGIVTKISETQIQMQLEQVEQGLNQLQMLNNQLENMANIDGALAATQLTGLQTAFQTMFNIQSQMISQLNNYSNFENSFKQVYTDFKDFKNLTPENYLSEANKLLIQTKNLTQDAMRAAGIVNSNKLNNDAQRVRALMSQTNSLAGQKAVMQAGVGMAAMQYETLSDMKILLSQSLNAQSAYIMKQIQQEEMARQEFQAGAGYVDVEGKSSGALKYLK